MITMVINDSPYGNERPYNALRLAMALVRQGETDLRIFLMGDAVVCGLAGQSTPQGYYNLGRMVESVARHGGEVALCGSCVEARGLKGASLVEGAAIGNMAQLAQWTVEAEKVVVF